MFPIEKTDAMLDLLVSADARKEGGPRLQERLRNIFELACRIGHQYGEKEIACVRKEAYEAGLKDGRRVAQASEQKASALKPIPFPPPRSLSTIAIQTDPFTLLPPRPPPVTTTATQTDPFLPPSPPPLHHDSLATQTDPSGVPSPHPVPLSVSPPSSAYSPRDFSDLSSGTSHPFASLQRRHRRSPRTPCSRSPPTPRTPRRQTTIILKISDSTSSLTKDLDNPPALVPQLDTRSSPSLEWHCDPRLRDLSRALTALGWVRPG